MWQRARGPLAGAAALAVSLAVLALASGGGVGDGSAPGIGTAPPVFLGLVAEDVFGKPGDYRRVNLGRMRNAGAGVVRQTFDWARIERSPGRYELERYDRFVIALAARRLRVLPILFNPPSFRSSAPRRGAARGTYPPARPADMAAFAATLARRYGPGGRLWRAHPKLRALPIRSWQVWNEPNLTVYWPSGPDPAEYVRLLRATADAIKRVDPRAEILTGGLPQSARGVPLGRYLAGMYAAGAADAFDTLALHPFARDARDVLATIRAARRVATTNGDDPAIWVTEVGWASQGPPSEFRVGTEAQARLVEDTLTTLARRRRELRLRGVVYFNWRDSLPYAGGRDFFGLHTGLLYRDGRAKPALGAYRGVAQDLGLLPGR